MKGASVNIRTEGSLISVSNGYWTATHDTTKGGALILVEFKHGRKGNVLSAPLSMGIGNFLDIHEAAPAVDIRQGRDEITLRFTGRLKDARGQGDIDFAQAWTYRPYGIHRAQQIYTDKPFDVADLCLSRFCVSPAYHHLHMVGASIQDTWHDGLARDVEYAVVPSTFGVFGDTGEGVQFVRGDDISAWGYNPAQMNTSFGKFLSHPDGDSFCCELYPFGNCQETSLSALQQDGGLSFDSFLGISNYKSRPWLPYREVAISSQPFPSDAEIKTLHDLGVNVIRVHEGANFVGNTIDHWMDGVFPPFEGAQLTEMKRLIKTAHLYGIKVIPYFMPQGVHPVSEAFRRHAREWQKTGVPNQVLRFSTPGGEGQIWETYMCLQSPFYQWLLDHITQVIEAYGFDGLYFDAPAALSGCYHPAHARVPHACEEAFLNLLVTLRQRFPDKLILHHQMTDDINLLHANLVDHIINLEEHGFKTPDELRPLPFGLTVQRACASVSPVPQPFLPKDGEPISPGFAMTKYKPGKEPTATRQLARRSFPYFIVHGAVPYIYTWMEKLTLGYRTNRDRIEDQEGFYYFYRLLKQLDAYPVEFYYAPEEELLQSSAPALAMTTLTGREGLLILICSSGRDPVHAVRIHAANAEANQALETAHWSKAELVVTTRPSAVRLERRGTDDATVVLETVHPDELYVVWISKQEQ